MVSEAPATVRVIAVDGERVTFEQDGLIEVLPDREFVDLLETGRIVIDRGKGANEMRWGSQAPSHAGRGA